MINDTFIIVGVVGIIGYSLGLTLGIILGAYGLGDLMNKFKCGKKKERGTK